jgi:hypothetical protein
MAAVQEVVPRDPMATVLREAMAMSTLVVQVEVVRMAEVAVHRLRLLLQADQPLVSLAGMVVAALAEAGEVAEMVQMAAEAGEVMER